MPKAGAKRLYEYFGKERKIHMEVSDFLLEVTSPFLSGAIEQNRIQNLAKEAELQLEEQFKFEIDRANEAVLKDRLIEQIRKLCHSLSVQDLKQFRQRFSNCQQHINKEECPHLAKFVRILVLKTSEVIDARKHANGPYTLFTSKNSKPFGDSSDPSFGKTN